MSSSDTIRRLSRPLVEGLSRRERTSSRAFGSTLASISSLFLVLLCVLVVIPLSSCGFRLQGSVELPPEVRRIYVATADELTPFAVELRDALSRNGATLAPAAGAADAVVRVRSDRTGRRVLSVSARNTPEEFEVFYVVDYSIDRGGQEVVPSQVLELTRSFSFDEADLLAKDLEEDILREAMARDIAGLIVRRLGSL
jgi:LPS-assembly lipoprotein